MTTANKIPSDTFETIVDGAGAIASEFDTESWTLSASTILGATNGGIHFKDEIAWRDLGENIDNAPKNTKELKKAGKHTVTLGTNFVSASKETIGKLIVTADLTDKKITPRPDVKLTDFTDLWFIADYGVDNAIAIHIMNAINTNGYELQTGDEENGESAAEFTAHYSIDDGDKVPYEIFFKN